MSGAVCAAPPRTSLSEKSRYQAYAFCWADILCETELDLTIRHAAGACEVLLGPPAAQLIGSRLDQLAVPADAPVLVQFLAQIRASGRAMRRAVRVKGPHGLISMALTGYAIDPDHGPIFVALRHLPPDERLPADDAKRDQATSLPDMEAFAQNAAGRISEMAAQGVGTQVSFIELDGYEKIAERLEPPALNALERRLGDCLRTESIGGDSACRVGEGRFSLVNVAGTDLDSLSAELRQLTSAVDPEGIGLTVNSAQMDTSDADQLNEEDIARGLLFTLNEFRSDGAAKLTLSSLTGNLSEMVAAAAGKVSEFKSLVKDRSFEMALQPIIDLRKGDIHHFEALCRLHGPNGGVSPFRMITFAEDTGMIHEFDLAMVEKVIDRLRKTPVNAEQYRVAVNLSGHSIGRPDFLDQLNALIRQEEWIADRLMFEITESARMSDLDAANEFIQSLRARGHKVCLDDFGAGAASFQYLSRLEVDVVKLDGSAIRNARVAKKGRAFLSALTALCRKLGVQTIAEMLDDDKALHFARDCGVDFVQGYLFGKPAKSTTDFQPLPNAAMLDARRK